MFASIEQMTGLNWKGQGPAFLVAGGHGATHWIMATFYVLVPFIREDLGLSYAEAGIFASVFFFSSFAANAGSGALVDITGRRVLLQAISLVIGGGALFIMGLAEASWLIIFMLVFIGATNNLWHPAAISYLAERFPGSRGYVLSIHTLGASFGDMIAPLVAGVLLMWTTWQTTAAVCAVPIFAMAVVLYMLLGGRGRGTSAEDRVDGDAAGGLSIGDYIKGILDVLRNGAFLGICLMAAFRSMAQNGLLFFLPLLMLDDLGFGSILLGVALTSLQVGGMIAGPVAGTLSDRTGRRPVVLAGLAATTLVIAVVPAITVPTPFVVLLVFLGFTLFAVRPVVHSWSMDLVPKEMSGSAISLLFGAQAGFSTLVPIVGGVIADIWGLETVFMALALCMGVATSVAFMLPPGKRVS